MDTESLSGEIARRRVLAIISHPDAGKTTITEKLLLFGKLMMNDHNVLLMDEPTNHMDMESIESLNMALEMYEGTLMFVSHDREFVSSLATRIIEIRDNEIVDFHGTYDEYLKSLGIE